MARKFFNERVNKKLPIGTIVVITIVVFLVIFAIGLLISVSSNSAKRKRATIELGDGVTIEINSELPTKTAFFKTLENVDEEDISADFDDVDITKIGKYGVKLEIYGTSYEGIVEVIDSEAPILKLKNLKIGKGETYKPIDFVDSCTDNSEEDCMLEFYSLGLTENGEKIDYSSYTEEGTYTIEIIAKDSSDNSTIPISTTLTIGEATTNNNENNNTETPVAKNCTYGDNSYDSNKYTLAIDVTNDGCAIDYNKRKEALEPVNSLINSEKANIQKQFNKLNLGSDVKLEFSSEIGTVLNSSELGIVGYTLKIQVLLNDAVVEEYYLKTDGTRAYSINQYNLS